MSKRPTSIASLPDKVPVFPLTGALLLPQTNKPLKIFEPRYIDMVDSILRGNRLLALVQPEKFDVEAPDENTALQQVGCIGRLVHFEETEEDHYLIVLEGVCRVGLTEEVITQDLYRTFKINPGRFADDFNLQIGETDVNRKRFLQIMRAYADFADIEVDWEEVEQTGTADLVNLCCMLSPYGAAEKQMLLEASSLATRAETLIALTEIEMMRSKTGTTLQ